MMILITKEDCQRCDYVKSHAPDSIDLFEIDANSPEGMSHLAFHGMYGNGTTFPVLITEDDVAIEGTVKIRKYLEGIVE